MENSPRNRGHFAGLVTTRNKSKLVVIDCSKSCAHVLLHLFIDSFYQCCSASRSNFSSLSKWLLRCRKRFRAKIGIHHESDKLLAQEGFMQAPVDSNDLTGRFAKPVGNQEEVRLRLIGGRDR